jgi:hypothetical protein
MKEVYYNVSQGKLLLFSSFFEASLHYAASMLVRTNLNAIINTSIEDELGKMLILLTALTVRLLRILRSLENTKKCLNHMVSVGTLKSFI